MSLSVLCAPVHDNRLHFKGGRQRCFIGKNLMALERSDVEKNRRWRDWA
jgi:hypothetical protein